MGLKSKPEDDEARKTFKWYLKKVSSDANLMMNSKNIVEYTRSVSVLGV